MPLLNREISLLIQKAQLETLSIFSFMVFDRAIVIWDFKKECDICLGNISEIFFFRRISINPYAFKLWLPRFYYRHVLYLASRGLVLGRTLASFFGSELAESSYFLNLIKDDS